MSEKPKKQFNLRKRPSSSHKIQPKTTQPPKLSKPPSAQGFSAQTYSRLPQESVIPITEQVTPGFSGPDLFLETSFVKFQCLVGKVNTQTIKITNRGSTSIHYQWIKIPKSNINPNATFDTTPKFSCLNSNNTIKPRESIVFPFSFYSKIPGFFSEQYELQCQPAPLNQIPLIKLEGNAYLVDEFLFTRSELNYQLNFDYINKCVRQIIQDIIDNVKSPQQPLPDLQNPEIAQKQFQKSNQSLGVFYNSLIFSWWSQLHKDVLQQSNIQSQQQWNLNLRQLKHQISTLKEQPLRQLFNFRYNNYFYLSQNPELNRSILYKDIYQMIGQVACNIAGVHNDTTRKQLQMWEINWKYPEQEQSAVEKKAKDDQLAKIKAEWLKKAKKKKWGEQEEKALMNDYRTKMSSKVKDDILDYFKDYQERSAYIQTNQIFQKQPLSSKYFRFLERLKTIQEVDIENRKILVKFQLLENQNTQTKIRQYEQYLEKKKQFDKKRQEQKKEQQKSKDKKKKAKGIVQIEEPTFDITEIFNKDSLQTLVQLIKYIQQKSVKMLTLLINFGPREIVPNQLYSLSCLYDYLKTIDSTIQFVHHNQLDSVKLKVQEDNYSDGTILLLQNCNFLPQELGKQQVEQKVNQLFAEEIVNKIQNLKYITDAYVNQNKGQQFSGISMFIQKQSVLGLDIWRNISVCLKAESSTMVIGGRLTPQKIILIERALWYAKEILLVGHIGIAFMMVKQGVHEFLDLKLSNDQVKAIKNIQQKINQEWQPHLPVHKRTPRPKIANIVLPVDIVIGKSQTNWDSSENISTISSLTQKTEAMQDCEVIDIGEQTTQQLINRINPGKYFIIQDIHLREECYKSSEKVYKQLYKQKENRKIRHQQQEKKGINYKADVIIIVINNLQFLDDKLELVEKKKKVEAVLNSNQQQQEYEQPQEEQELQEQEQQEQKNKRKLRNLPDFQLKSSQYPIKVLSGVFSPVLSRISRFPRSDLD